MFNRFERWWCLVCFMAVMAGARPAAAHDVDSASLTLTEVAEGRFRVVFHTGSSTLERELTSPAQFPEPCRYDRGELTCGERGLTGKLEFPWLEGTSTRLFLEIEWLDGRRLLRAASKSSPTLAVYGAPTSRGGWSAWPVLSDYTVLGLEHILIGIDHVLFVIALTLLVRRPRTLLATITAFTLAHSLTLASTVLGWVEVPAPPLEAAIALSIVLVCAECARPSASLTARAPWLIAFAFGLLHGSGFASALLAVGLPEGHTAAALFSFNVGIELGQLGIIAAVLGLRWLARRLQLHRDWTRRGAVYLMGSAAGYFCVERVAAVFRAAGQ
jgi:hydrogenase/urease accessory protein HupE